MAIELEFPSRSEANSVRDEHPIDWFTKRYDRRHKTVEFTDDADPDVVERLEIEAERGKAEREGGAGQPPLTDAEKSRIDFSKPNANVLHARSVKGIFTAKGISNWVDHYDGTLSVDEHRGIADRIKEEGHGGDARLDESESEQRRRRAKSAEKGMGGQCDHARDHCENGDADACEFLGESCGFDDEEVEQLLEEPIDEDDIEEITGKALGALKRAWGGYHGSIAELEECIESTVEAWNNAQQAARTINRVREGHGQEPLELENLQEQQARLSAFASVASDDCHECQGLPGATDRDVEQAIDESDDGDDALEVEESGQTDLSGEQKTPEQQASFSVDDDIRQAQGRESRREAEQSTGGLMEDTRTDASRGAEREQESTEQQSFRDPNQSDLTHE